MYTAPKDLLRILEQWDEFDTSYNKLKGDAELRNTFWLVSWHQS